MTACPAFSAQGPAGVAEALRSVDCLSGQATETAFGRLFGAAGALGGALTLLLTIYIALLAVNLLTGRSRLGLSMLTPRAFALGLALTFATSWVAYQSVVWNLAIGAPDQVASIISGTQGSATSIFAHRLDSLFSAITDAAQAVPTPAEGAATGPKPAGFSPSDVLWLGAFMLLLGTVGVLIVTRIALAALLALGPIFVMLSLFRGTRGLFEGWLKSVALFALTPMFAVLIGGGALALLTPVIAGLAGGEIDMRAAGTVLVGAFVYCALMIIVLKVSVTITSGWRLQEHREGSGNATAGSARAQPTSASRTPDGAFPQAGAPQVPNSRARDTAVAAAAIASRTANEAGLGSIDSSDRVRLISSGPAPLPTAAAPAGDVRIRGIGSQYRVATNSVEKRL